MSVGNWTPSATNTVTKAELLQLCSYVENRELNITDDSKLIGSHAWLMKQNKEFWQPLLTTFEQAELERLLEFFTLIEVARPEWQGGDCNPVIFIAKVLKRQFDAFPDKDTIRWIKTISDNKFLPYGPLL